MKAAILALAMLATPAGAKTIAVAAGPDAQERLQQALLDAAPGDTVAIGAGRFELTDQLSLDVARVTVRGAGQARTVLSRGEVVWSHGRNEAPAPGRGKYIPRRAFPSASRALSTWRALNSPRFVHRDPQNIPSGV